MDDLDLSPQTGLALFAAHLAAAIREASSLLRTQRVTTARHERARVISERIARKKSDPTLPVKGDERLFDHAIEDIQALSDAMRHLAWLSSSDKEQQRQAVAYHQRMVQALAQRLGEDRAARYRYDAAYLERCLQLILEKE